MPPKYYYTSQVLPFQTETLCVNVHFHIIKFNLKKKIHFPTLAAEQWSQAKHLGAGCGCGHINQPAQKHIQQSDKSCSRGTCHLQAQVDMLPYQCSCHSDQDKGSSCITWHCGAGQGRWGGCPWHGSGPELSGTGAGVTRAPKLCLAFFSTTVITRLLTPVLSLRSHHE